MSPDDHMILYSTGLWLPNIPNFDGVELAQVSHRHGNQYLV